jgi:hypothetical protein
LRHSPGPSEIRSNLPDSVDQQLTMYTLAATAAGVGMLALAQPAAATIVYTKANVQIPRHTQVFVDLNHDGVNDFFFWFNTNTCHGGVCVTNLNVYSAVRGNAVLGQNSFAFALRAGARIGPRGPFPQRDWLMGERSESSGNPFDYFGAWANSGKGVKNRYLGLKFQINGKTHFGWARLTVNAKTLVGTLTGYAYETVANRPIIAGKTKGPDEVSVEPANAAFTVPPRKAATLALLAMGSPGLSIWRREEQPATAQ